MDDEGWIFVGGFLVGCLIFCLLIGIFDTIYDNSKYNEIGKNFAKEQCENSNQTLKDMKWSKLDEYDNRKPIIICSKIQTLPLDGGEYQIQRGE